MLIDISAPLRLAAAPFATPLAVLAALLLPACVATTGKPDPVDTGAADTAEDGDPGDTDPSPGAGADTDTDTDSGTPADDTAPGGDTDTSGEDTDTPGDPGGGTDSGTPGEDSGTPDDTGTTDPVAEACGSWDEPVIMGTVADGRLNEISGIVPSRMNPGVLWVHNDSGGEPELYALDTSGELLGTLRLSGATNRDWEDLAIGPCPEDAGDCLWVGDVGDNGLSRDDVALYTVPEPVVTDAGFDETAASTRWDFSYPDGRNNVEGLAIGSDGLPVIVTKRVDSTADVYRFPSMAPNVTLDLVSRITTGGQVTASDISADGTRLLVRTYNNLEEFTLVDGVPRDPVRLPAPDEPQGEAVAYDAALNGIWITSESANQPLWFVACAD